MNEPITKDQCCTLEQLRELTSIQAENETLWDITVTSIETAYAQQALRYLTCAVEGTWSFEKAKAAILEMAP